MVQLLSTGGKFAPRGLDEGQIVADELARRVDFVCDAAGQYSERRQLFRSVPPRPRFAGGQTPGRLVPGARPRCPPSPSIPCHPRTANNPRVKFDAL